MMNWWKNHFKVKRHTQGLASIMIFNSPVSYWTLVHSSPEVSGRCRSRMVHGMWVHSHIPEKGCSPLRRLENDTHQQIRRLYWLSVWNTLFEVDGLRSLKHFYWFLLTSFIHPGVEVDFNRFMPFDLNLNLNSKEHWIMKWRNDQFHLVRAFFQVVVCWTPTLVLVFDNPKDVRLQAVEKSSWIEIEVTSFKVKNIGSNSARTCPWSLGITGQETIHLNILIVHEFLNTEEAYGYEWSSYSGLFSSFPTSSWE